jgi:hypothetical protein
MRNRSIAAAAAVLLLSGCAIHPVPEDVTGLKTSDIVKQIRCETRDAARKVIRKILADMGENGDLDAQALGEKFEANPELMVGFNPRRDLPGSDRRLFHNAFDVIYAAGVAYNFDLTMTEDNNFSGTVNFLGPWNVATVKLGISPDFKRQRQNVRTFTVTDTIGFLLRELNTPNSRGKQYCDGHIALGPNYVYPIAGQIGAYNTVYTFFQLSFFDGLAAHQADPGAGGAPTMADQLTFTTTIDVSVTPSVTFNPVTSGFQVTDSNATAMLSRIDAHQVSVGLALDPKGKGFAALTGLRGVVFSGLGGAPRVAASRGGLLMLNRVTANTNNGAEQLAVLAIDQLKSREFQLITRRSP